MSKRKVTSRWGFFAFGLVVGYIIGDSKTSVSAIAVSSLLGFMGAVLSMIVEGKGDNNRIIQNLDLLGVLFAWFSVGLALGILGGSYMKAGEIHIFSFTLRLPPISSDVLNP